MADHAHKQIRGALETALGGLTTSGARVYANRLHPMDAGSLPGLRIYAESEDAEALTIHSPHVQDRTLGVVVECCVKAVLATADDTLDLMSKEVETALAAGLSVTGQTLYPFYRGMQMDLEPADLPVGIKRLRYGVTFATQNNAPDVFV